jgi:hypothetical protein
MSASIRTANERPGRTAMSLELVSIAALLESAPADEAAGDAEEALVDVGASFVADEQAAELV